MPKKSGHPIDVHVGSRMRIRRMLVGISQEKLGEELAVTFQQIQKYEQGKNRISASRLFEMSQVLGVPVMYFFEGLASSDVGSADLAHERALLGMVTSSEGLELNRAFAAIKRPRVRRSVRKLVESLAGVADEDEPQPPATKPKRRR